MKLVLKEYLSMLKEKDELDTLLLDLLLLDGYQTQNIPKSGERQYGVDIIAEKQDTSYLFVVKQQNMNRRNWDSDPNSVRQSINEIHDIYVPVMLPSKWKNKPIHIIVATNGYLEDSVRPNWENYCKEHQYINGQQYIYDFWGIDDLVALSYNHAFNENLFSKNMQSDLRKVLYFLDDVDMENRYFEKIIDSYIALLNDAVGQTKLFKKQFISFFMCVNLILQWAHEQERFKLSIKICEYVIIKYWAFLFEHGLFENEKFILNLIKFLSIYEKANQTFFDLIQAVAVKECDLPHANPLEHRLIIYEIIGFMSSYGFYLLGKDRNQSNDITGCLIAILNINQAYKYPIYDKNISEISMLFLLLKNHNRASDLNELIFMLIHGLMINHIHNKKMPAPNDKYEEALSIEFGKSIKPYEASILYSGLLEWCCVMGNEEEYLRLQEYVKKYFESITLQTWQINKDEETEFYSANAVYNAGASYVLDIDSSIENQISIIKQCSNMDDFEEFTFNKYSFPAIAIITSRYYGYPVLPEFWRKYIEN